MGGTMNVVDWVSWYLRLYTVERAWAKEDLVLWVIGAPAASVV